jgi:hypothetical protein
MDMTGLANSGINETKGALKSAIEEIEYLDKENARLKEQYEYLKSCQLEHLKEPKLIAELEKENARLKEDNRSGMNALKLSGQALSKALDDVEALLAENKRIVGEIKGDGK